MSIDICCGDRNCQWLAFISGTGSYSGASDNTYRDASIGSHAAASTAASRIENPRSWREASRDHGKHDYEPLIVHLLFPSNGNGLKSNMRTEEQVLLNDRWTAIDNK